MKAVVYAILLVLPIARVCYVAAQETLTAREIVDRSQKASRLAGSEAVSKMTIIDARGRQRVREIAQVSKLYDDGATEKKLVRFLAPADVKGTGLLTFDYEDKTDDLWLFMPALRKTRRIVGSEKAKSFMGSEFSYADMAPPPLDDFEYRLLAGEAAGGVECWKIEAVPRTKEIASENGFSKKISWIAKVDLVFRKVLYYDAAGDLHKELTVRKVKELDAANGIYRPVDLGIVNKQNGRQSLLVVDKIELVPDIGDEFFTTRYLERL